MLAGGRVIDPAQGLDQILDVAIANGTIASVGPGGGGVHAKRTLDVSGHVVTPGLIDMHTHVFNSVTEHGTDPDEVGVLSGVTTVVDAGTSGAHTFDGLRDYVISKAKTSVYCLLNLSTIGIITTSNRFGELRQAALLDEERTVGVVRSNPGLIRGIKLRAVESAVGPLGIDAVKIGKRTAHKAGVPLVLHIGEPRPDPLAHQLSTSAILDLLESGDIVCHCYTSRSGGVFTDPAYRSSLEKAVRRGVLLDVAHGMNNLNFPIAQRALRDGFLPFTISSDVTKGSRNRSVYDLPTVMSKFLALGLTLPDVVLRTTRNPATALGIQHRAGALIRGFPADVSVLRLRCIPWSTTDSDGNRIDGREVIEPVISVKDGDVIQVAERTRPWTEPAAN